MSFFQFLEKVELSEQDLENFSPNPIKIEVEKKNFHRNLPELNSSKPFDINFSINTTDLQKSESFEKMKKYRENIKITPFSFNIEQKNSNNSHQRLNIQFIFFNYIKDHVKS